MVNPGSRRRRIRFSLKWLLVLPALAAAFVLGWKDQIEEQRSTFRQAELQVSSTQQAMFLSMYRIQKVRKNRPRQDTPTTTASRTDELMMKIEQADHQERLKQLENHPLNR